MESVLGNTRKADITFHPGGRICISARASRLLGLNCGDVVDIMESYGECYLYVRYHAPVVGRHEGTVYRSNRNGRHFLTSSKRLCEFIFAKCTACDRVRLCCGNPIKLSHYGTALPIITMFML